MLSEEFEFSGVHYLSPENMAASNFGLMQETNTPSFNLNRFLNTFYDNNPHPFNHPVHEFPQQSTSLSNTSSTSDEADENQLRVIDERKQRRMISNRESARRSRMRKQKHLDELWSQVVRLRNENHTLVDKLNHVSQSHDNVVQENARLKEEASDLRKMLTDFQIGSPFTATALRDLEESSKQSISSSVDLLH
ncbi:basic leucine-zipper 43 [Euphorbia peplus]|nr:basic leucine-zipper 43 [Euphorbia peplus]